MRIIFLPDHMLCEGKNYVGATFVPCESSPECHCGAKAREMGLETERHDSVIGLVSL